MLRAYGPRKEFKPEQLTLIRQANEVIEKYEKAGYVMTLRQLYYQMVAKNLIPNSGQSYDRLGRLISDGRLQGLISWTSIDDRLRQLQGAHYEDSPEAGLRALSDRYREDKWMGQRCRVEVIVEKDAMAEIVAHSCLRLGVDWIVMRGYASSSALWRTGQRYIQYMGKGQRPIVLHLGDHDPSGLDMSRDMSERINMFTGTPITFIRIALNIDQVTDLSLPPNPAKLSDSRAGAYIRKFGQWSWELDALPPDYIHRLIESNVLKWRDAKLWDEALATEAENKRLLGAIADDIDRQPVDD